MGALETLLGVRIEFYDSRLGIVEVVEYSDFYRSLGNGGGIWVVS